MNGTGPATALNGTTAVAANFHVGIIAGGIGERFVPYSSPELPKQFLPITHKGRTMLQVTLDRFAGVVPRDRIWIATNEKYIGLVKEQAPGVREMNIIGEPVKRNTAPAIATLMHRIAQHGEEAVGAIMPADHYIGSTDVFQEQLLHAADFALRTGYLLTFGIPPTWASPDYGYIEAGAPQLDDPAFFSVDRFVEKPSEKVAKGYLKKGNYFWNSGMFVWGAHAFLDHLAGYQPLMHAGLELFYGDYDENTPLPRCDMLKYFIALHGISIDYALMEPASLDGNVAMLPFDTEWSDVGTWEGLKALVDSGRASPPKNVLSHMKKALAKKAKS